MVGPVAPMVAGRPGSDDRAGRRVRDRSRRDGARQCPARHGERGNRDRHPGRAQGMPSEAPAANLGGDGSRPGRGFPQALGPLGDLRGAGRPRPGIFGRQLSDQRGDFRGHPGRQRRQWLVQVCQRHRQGFSGEGTPAGQALEGHDAQRVQVGGGRRGRTRRPFWCQVRRSSHQRPGAGKVRGSSPLGDTEISDLHVPCPADQQVAWFDVAVYQAGRVRCLQGAGGLSHQAHRVRRSERSPFKQPGERRPVDQFHHQVGGMWRLGPAVVIDLRDTRVRQRRRMPGLRTEPGQVLLMNGIPGPQQLHRDLPAKRRVSGAPDFPHPARSNKPVQSIPTSE